MLSCEKLNLRTIYLDNILQLMRCVTARHSDIQTSDSKQFVEVFNFDGNGKYVSIWVGQYLATI
jgi:hypothetical protein